jgi:hypothetical protein
LSASDTQEISGVPTGIPGLTNGTQTKDIKDQVSGINFGAAFGLGVDFGK